MTESLFPGDIADAAVEVVTLARAAGVRLATVETVTGGLIAAALTDVPGVSEVYERGFVLYHASAKATGLDIDPVVAARYGAVSAPVTEALAAGLSTHSGAAVGVAVTGYAGPTGGNDADPVGTVYVAGFRKGGSPVVRREVFGGDRTEVKLQAVRGALSVVRSLLSDLEVAR